LETEGDGGSRVGERGRYLTSASLIGLIPRVRTIFAHGHMGIPETDGRKLGLSAGRGSWYEWGVMVGAREWRETAGRIAMISRAGRLDSESSDGSLEK
jgi:hypothetical protein